MRVPATLLLAALILLIIAHLRPPEYDESYSIFLTAGDPRPAWPTTPFSAAQVRPLYEGHTTLTQIAQNLRTLDVHPPLYFWILKAWRHIFGESWQTSRLLSVLFSIATLATLARLARQTKTPVIPTILITLLAYSYAYTSTLTRNFALAQLLTTLGLTLTLETVGWVSPAQRGVTHHFPAQNQPPWKLTAAGVLFSLATFTNYLSIFTPIATLLWLATRRPLHDTPSCRRKPASTLFFLIGLTLFLPADLYFFTAQHASRTTQFPPFHPIQALTLIAKDSGAALFGGLPLYAAPYTTQVAIALLIFFLLCLTQATKPALFTLTALATPIGLFFLGLTFHNTPIEIRYLAFSIPPLAVILATLPKPLLTTLIAIESLGTIGLALAPSTMQPQGPAARQAAALATPTTLTLIPYGNDGVGIPGPFIEAAPNTLNIELIHPGEPPNLSQAPRIILAKIRADDSSRAAVEKTLNYLENNPCWAPGPATPLTAVFENRCPQQQN
jgi:hypothetical protein